MAKYVSIRGWIECDDESLNCVLNVINKYENEYEKFYLKEEQSKHYQKGWVFSSVPTGWTRYIFFGADVKNYNVDFFTQQLREICQLKMEINGRFFLDSDEGCDESDVYIEIKDDNKVENKPA